MNELTANLIKSLKRENQNDDACIKSYRTTIMSIEHIMQERSYLIDRLQSLEDKKPEIDVLNGMNPSNDHAILTPGKYEIDFKNLNHQTVSFQVFYAKESIPVKSLHDADHEVISIRRIE